jgi:hypothetical protein
MGPKRIAAVRPVFDAVASSLTFAIPAAARPGDVMLAILADGADASPAFASGWTSIINFFHATAAIRAHVREVGEREQAAVFDWPSSSTDLQGQLIVYRPSSRGALYELHATATLAAVTNHNAPAVACQQPQNVEICVWRANGAITYTPPAGMTQVDNYTSSLVAARTLLVAELEPAGVVGTLPARTAVASSAVVGAAVSLVLRERAPLRAPGLSRLAPGNIGLLA